MACILHIETSTEVCSTAISQDGNCLYFEEERKGPAHAQLLSTFVQETLSFADSHAIPLDAVAISCGPGSYTGLRIGVSTAKGVCYGRNVPLIALPTLQIMCVPLLLFNEEIPENALLCPMIDARRMEVYSCVYDRSLKEIRSTKAEIITPESFQDLLEEYPIYFFGNGAMKCETILEHSNAHFLSNVVPQAKYMFPLAEQHFLRNHFEDVAYFEPFYLKEFIATKAKNPLL